MEQIETITHGANCGCSACHSHEHNHKEVEDFDFSIPDLIFGTSPTVPSAPSDPVSGNFVSGDNRIDSLTEGFSWTGSVGQPSPNLTYAFNNNRGDDSFFDASDRAAATSALQAWANVANVTFTESSTFQTANITFANTTFPDNFQQGVAQITFSGSSIRDVDIEMNGGLSTLAPNSIGYLILLHEVGHALGLKHSGDYGAGDPAPFLSRAEDNYRSTVMSYNEDSLVTGANAPVTPMLYDILAIQYLYGANSSFNSGNNVYDLSLATNPNTIWDGGGLDVLTAVNYAGSDGVVVDLRSGLENVTTVGSNLSWVAFGANIENAEGSNSNDSLIGSEISNTLAGRLGRDFLLGNDGNDTIYGGQGVVDTQDIGDVIYGGNGSDSLYGNAGDDSIFGGEAIADADDEADFVYGGKGADSIYGNAGNDTLYGGGSGFDPFDEADLIYGGAGADEIYGNGNNDVIYGGGDGFDPNDAGDIIFGGAGNDSVFGNGGNDSIYGNGGNDVLNGGGGDDSFFFNTGDQSDTIQVLDGAGVAGGDIIFITSNINNSGIASVTDVLAATTYSGGNAFINLGGETLTVGGLGTATLGFDDVQIV